MFPARVDGASARWKIVGQPLRLPHENGQAIVFLQCRRCTEPLAEFVQKIADPLSFGSRCASRSRCERWDAAKAGLLRLRAREKLSE
jgi:hypothetical protein